MFQHRAATVRILAYTQNTIYPCPIVSQRAGKRKGFVVKKSETNAAQSMNAVIYTRFSSHNQTEQSIEGQLRVCHDYAQREGYKVVGEYIDRAISGKTDDRPDFQQMIADSKKKAFQFGGFGRMYGRFSGPEAEDGKLNRRA